MNYFHLFFSKKSLLLLVGCLVLLSCWGAVFAASWNYTSPLPIAIHDSAAVTHGGYVYVIGGMVGGYDCSSAVFRASVNADGSLGSWESLAPMSKMWGRGKAVVIGNNVYLVGGSERYDTAELKTVQKASFNPDGTLSAFTSETNLMNRGRVDFGLVYTNGYIYAIGGGSSGSRLNTVEFAQVNADGSIGTWYYTSNLNLNRWLGVAVADNGYIYSMGGADNSGTKVEYAQVSTNGYLSAWQYTGNNMPTCWVTPGLVVKNSKLYAFGGWDANEHDGSDLIQATINANGSLSDWSNLSTSLNQCRSDFGALEINGVFYAIGGHKQPDGYSILSTVEYVALINTTPGNSEDWPMYAHDEYRTSLSPDAILGLPLVQKWKFSSGISHYAQGLAVVGDRVYSGIGTKVFALDTANGNSIWTYTGGSDFDNWITVSDGIIYAGNHDGKMYAIKAADGSLLSCYTASNWVRGSATVKYGRVYFTAFNGKVYAARTTDLSPIWEYSIGGTESAPTVIDGIVYVGGGNTVYALNADNGSLVWSDNLGSNINSTPAYTGGKVLIGSQSGFYVINAINGSIIWNKSIGVVNYPPVISGDTVFVSTANGNIYSMLLSNATVLWNTALPSSFATYIIGANGVLYIATGSNRGFATVRMHNGTFVGETMGPDNLNAISRGVYYHCDIKGNVYAYVKDTAYYEFTPPQGLTGIGGNSAVYLNWAPSTYYNLDGYNVYRNSGDKLNTTIFKNTFFTDTTVTNGVTYKYYVKAVDNLNNESDSSNEVFVTPTTGETVVVSEDWPMYAHDEFRTSLSLDTILGLPLVQKWKFSSGISHYAQGLAVVGDRVYSGIGTKVFALDTANGNSIWTYTGASDFDNWITVSDGVVYAGNHDGKMYAIKAADGSLLSCYTASNWVRGSATVKYGRVYFTSFNGKVYAARTTDLSPIWEYSIGGTESAPTVIDGIVYVGGGSTVYALNADNGSLVWSDNLGSNINSTPAYTGGKVLIGSQSGFYVINAINGSIIWNKSIGVVNYPPVISGDTVFVSTANGNIYSMLLSNATVLWNTALPSSFATYIIGANGVLYIATGSNRGFATVRMHNGTFVGETMGPDNLNAISRGVYYHCDIKGNVYAYVHDPNPSGLAGSALSFDNLNDFVQVPDSSSLGFSNTITVEAWIKPYDIYSPGVICSKDDNRTRREFHLGIHNLDGSVQFVIFTDSNHWTYVRGGKLVPNAWQHVAGVYDGSSISLFVNGKLTGSTPIQVAMTNTDVPLTIGNWFATDRPFSGVIDDVRIWNVARTKTQINDSLFCPLAGNESGLVAYWNFDEGQGQIANDVSGHGNIGQLGISNVSDNWDPSWVSSGAPLNCGNETGEPLPPLNLKATAGNNNVYLEWDGNNEFVSGYNVYRRTNTSNFQKINNALVEESSYQDNVVTNGVTYYYVVRSVNASVVESANSNEVSATPLEAGYSLHFDGLNDTVSIPDAASFSMNSTLTIEAWMKAENYSNLNGAVVGKDDYSNNREYFIAVNNGLYFVVHRPTGGWDFARTNVPSLNTWNHVAGVYDGSLLKLYLNGELVASTTHSGNIPDTNAMFNIGNSGDGSRPFKGSIEEVRVWNIARNQNSIQSTMNLCLSGTESGLVGYWKLGEGSGQLIHDSGTNGNNGYLGIASESDYADPTWANSDLRIICDENAPSTPHLAAQGLCSQVDLSWSTASSENVAGFNVYRKTSDSLYRKINNNLIGNSNFVDLNVSNGTTYFYTIKAVASNDMESLNSNEASAIPRKAPPTAPVNLSAQERNNKIILSWSANTESDLAGYNVYRSDTTAGYVKINSGTIGTANYTDLAVANETTYYYYVTALDTIAQEGLGSDVISATPHLMLNEFKSADDTSRWVFALPTHDAVSSLPAISWLPEYESATGVMRVNFDEPQQGIKMTLQIPEWFSSDSGKWYELVVTLKSDDTTLNTLHSIHYLYNGVLPQGIDISGNALFSELTVWHTRNVFLSSIEGTGNHYAQILLKNKANAPVSLYIDKAQILEIAEPDLSDISYEGSDFNQESDTTYWGYEEAMTVAGMPAYAVESGVMKVTFTGSSTLGLKMTMSPVPAVTKTFKAQFRALSGQRGIYTYSGLTGGHNLFSVQVYGTDSEGGTNILEISGSARINRFDNGSSGEVKSIFYPFYPYTYGQLIIKNSAAGTLDVDDLYPLGENTVLNNVPESMKP